MTLPNSREMKVLDGLGLGDIESDAKFAGVGRKTYEQMVAKGWIEHATCPTYGTVGFRITKAGEEAHESGYKAGVRGMF